MKVLVYKVTTRKTDFKILKNSPKIIEICAKHGLMTP